MSGQKQRLDLGGLRFESEAYLFEIQQQQQQFYFIINITILSTLTIRS